MATEYAIQGQAYILYDGANSAEILAAFAAARPEETAVIHAEGGGSLSVSSTGYYGTDTYTVTEGNYFFVGGGSVTAEDWALKFIKV
jgi:hypothetical protein